MQTVYNRFKDAGKWRYRVVKEGPGKKTGSLEPPFYIRRSENGKQYWHNLNAQTFADAKATAAKVGVSLQATAQGIVVAESQDLANVNRRVLKDAVSKFIEDTKLAGRSRKTVSQYRRSLSEFEDAAKDKRVKFLDEITEETLKHHMRCLRERGLAGKTIDTRTTVVAQFMGAHNLKPRLKSTQKPTVEEEPPTPYTKEELDALFAAMTDDADRIRYRFFLRTGCREQEVQFASWKDIDFTHKTYTVRKKEDVHFTPKNHESRVIPLRDDFVSELKAYQKQNGDCRWLFPNKQGKPDGHMLRRLKKIAFQADLNCGHCRSTITVGEYNGKKQVEVSCKTHPVCEHFILHRFRKTCATRWESDGLRVRDIQVLLGHKNLEITQKYLGVSSQEDLRKRINNGD